jgi:hypothetical protein
LETRPETQVSRRRQTRSDPSYSGDGSDGDNSDCVALAWRKSSRSGRGAENTDCVELAASAVRDSKNPARPVLHLDITALVAAVKAGQIV